LGSSDFWRFQGPARTSILPNPVKQRWEENLTFLHLLPLEFVLLLNYVKSRSCLFKNPTKMDFS
jgi:hypothetical protein